VTIRSTDDAATCPAHSEQVWDAALIACDGHLLQSWRWGEFKARHGWEVRRVFVAGETPDTNAMAQVLIRKRGPLGLAYIPRGATFGSQGHKTAIELFDEVDRTCKRAGCINVIVEPDRPLPYCGRFKEHGFVRGPEHVQPARTVKVPLLDDEPLLAQMHQKTRYSVRLAERRGVEIRRVAPNGAAMNDFFSLLLETSGRNEFGIHDEAYYRDFMLTFGDHALLAFAFVEGMPAAALIAARFGDSAIYMYGASSTTYRAHGAAYALQFNAMKWAREAGCSTYDLWGIPLADPESTQGNGDRVATTRGDDWRGLYKFKTGFGGNIVTYPPTLERRYRPMLSFMARRFYAKRVG